MNTERTLPALEIDIDPRNPGQFYACCGLLELAHWIWGTEARGWFRENRFCLHVESQSPGVIDGELLACLKDMTFVAQNDDSGSPIVVHLGDGREYRLDWWTKQIYWHGSLRTWGRGTSYNLIAESHRECLGITELVSGFTRTAKMTSRLSVDPRASWTALDAGFSPNDQNFTVSTFPLVEFLAGIGLQRNRPSPLKKLYWHYTLWSTPVPSVLVPTVKYMLPRSDTTVYLFEIASRGQMARYFTPAIQGEHA